MIIDCHGHYTTEPKDLLRWRKEQIEHLKELVDDPYILFGVSDGGAHTKFFNGGS